MAVKLSLSREKRGLGHEEARSLILRAVRAALAAEGDEQQETWNQCFDLLAEQCVLYPVLQVQTVTGSWNDPSTAPQGTAIEGFAGIGTTGMSFIDCNTVTA